MLEVTLYDVFNREGSFLWQNSSQKDLESSILAQSSKHASKKWN